MPGHTRLYRRGAVYYHRAAVPQDIRDTYGKVEETFSLKTRDRTEAVRRVRIAAVEVDRRFEEHRRLRDAPPLTELSPDQLAQIKAAYLHHLLDEDEETRLDGFYDPEEVAAPEHPLPRPTFEEYAEGVSEADGDARYLMARGKSDAVNGGAKPGQWAAQNQATRRGA